MKENERPSPARTTTRPRGRPRSEINSDAVADAVAELFTSGGEDAVNISDVAQKVGVSRATLYRTVPTREHLMGILFERSTDELTNAALAIIDEISDPAEQLTALVNLLTREAVRMRRYMPVFFGGGGLPTDVVSRWHSFAQNFESLWVHVIKRAMEAGYLRDADPVISARLLLGQCLWVSRWYRPSGPHDVDEIARTAIQMLPLRSAGHTTDG